MIIINCVCVPYKQNEIVEYKSKYIYWLIDWLVCIENTSDQSPKFSLEKNNVYWLITSSQLEAKESTRSQRNSIRIIILKQPRRRRWNSLDSLQLLKSKYTTNKQTNTHTQSKSHYLTHTHTHTDYLSIAFTIPYLFLFMLVSHPHSLSVLFILLNLYIF